MKGKLGQLLELSSSKKRLRKVLRLLQLVELSKKLGAAARAARRGGVEEAFGGGPKQGSGDDDDPINRRKPSLGGPWPKRA